MTEEPTYLDASAPVEARVDDLVERMTVEEKVGQLVGTYVGQLASWQDAEGVRDAIEDHHVGSVAPFGWGGALHTDPREATETARELQEHAREETRLGVPLLCTADAVHGHAYVTGATAFPNNLGLAAAWDPDLAEQVATVTARELRATGIHQNYNPTCDVARDPRWGRTFETYGESPYLVAELSGREVEGYQGAHEYDDESVVATAKHFPAYGDPTRGEDAAPVEIAESTLRRVFLPPFEAAIEAGADSVMPCYNSIDTEPVHGSRRYLTELLREELDFDGHVVSDWGGVDHLHDDHRVTEDGRESAYLARRAGVDVVSIGGQRHAEHLLDLLAEGELSEAAIDRGVRRVLRAKFELGLFEGDLPDPDEAEAVLGREEHLDVAREAVRKSLTLLTNDGLLPLDPADLDEVFVGGPNADDMVAQLGGWSVDENDGLPGTTVREGIEAAVGDDATVTYERGSGIAEPGDVEAAAEKAADADVAVVAVGEDWYIHEFGPSGQSGHDTHEFPTRTELRLPDPQRELVEAIQETGTPTVGVLVTGRPLAVPELAESLDALMLAYYPGTVGGEVLGEALVGDVEPGGRLAISMPKSTGDLPTYFNYLPHPRPIGDHEHPDSYDPLFEFGHGLGYTTIETTDLAVSDTDVGPGESVEVDVTVENVGDRAGDEVVQLYVTDRRSSRVTPVRELKGFQRVEDLAPGEDRTVTIELSAEELGVIERDGRTRIEHGAFDLVVDDYEAELHVDAEYEIP